MIIFNRVSLIGPSTSIEKIEENFQQTSNHYWSDDTSFVFHVKKRKEAVGGKFSRNKTT